MHDYKEEISLPNRKIHFEIVEGGFVSRITGTGDRWTMYEIAVSPDEESRGAHLRYVDMVGMGETPNWPIKSYLVSMFSDSIGFYGYLCPDCNSYFRSTSVLRNATCPYCEYYSTGFDFLTENQKEYIRIYAQKLQSCLKTQESFVFDVNEIIGGLTENVQKWDYKEEKQQSVYFCKSCKEKYDILGEYGVCPNCCEPNVEEVFSQKIKALRNEIQESSADNFTHNVIELVTKTESMCKWIRSKLLLSKMTPKRRKQIKRINFQRISDANDLLKEYFAIDIFKNINDEQKEILRLAFGKRHLQIHCESVVDQDFLDKFPDYGFKLHETIKTEKEEVFPVIAGVEKLIDNFIQEYKSFDRISPYSE